MHPDDFQAPHAGRIVRSVDGHPAFVPSPLPPKLVFDNDLVLRLSKADAALSELAGLGRVLPNPRLLVTLFMIERERMPQPLLYLSEYIEARKTGYCACLQRTRTHGDWAGWLRYFRDGLAWNATRAARQARELMDLRNHAPLRRRRPARAGAGG